jgi:signal peptidase I
MGLHSLVHSRFLVICAPARTRLYACRNREVHHRPHLRRFATPSSARTNSLDVAHSPNHVRAMSETTPAGAASKPEKPAPTPAKAKKKEDNFFVFLIKLVVIVVLFRSFVVSPYNIPSESMLPRLLDGDYLLAVKWPYGYSKYSLPFNAPLIPGRILAHQPERGDVVIFKAPANPSQDWIKRVIGLPGDQIQMINGQLNINGKPIPKLRVADAVVPVSPNTQCYLPMFQKHLPDGRDVCSYPQFRETLPGGKSYTVLDLTTSARDDTPPVLVPEGSVFVMGDNRDNSLDSRFSVDEGGVGMLPQQNLVGRATIMMFSTDGSSNWLLPWTWFTAARWNRIGGTF